MFKSVSETILSWSEEKGFLPGIVSVLHTFGSQLNFNCHIHTLYTLGGVDLSNARWKSLDFIPVPVLKQRFKTRLLHHLRTAFKEKNVVVPEYVKREWFNKFGTSVFWNVQNELYKNEWYLYIGDKLENVVLTVGYIGRYAKRPAVSETRILYYSKNENIVRFSFHDKTTGEDKIISTSIHNFIGLLVRHIPEKNFHVIRYGGAYANARKNRLFKLIADQISAMFGLARMIFEFSLNRAKSWRQRIVEQGGDDPLKCKSCNIDMIRTQITYYIRDGTRKTIFLF